MVSNFILTCITCKPRITQPVPLLLLLLLLLPYLSHSLVSPLSSWIETVVLHQVHLVVHIRSSVLPFGRCVLVIGPSAKHNNTDQAPVVQRADNFIRWIRHSSGSKIYLRLNVVQGFCTLANLAVVRVYIFACT